jgi:prophage endopeptidase
MIGLPNPKFILAAVIACGLAYGYGHHNGWWERDLEMQAEIGKRNEESRAKEQELLDQLNSQSSKLTEANDAITQKQSALDRAISSGRVRLPTSSCVQTNAGSSAPNGNQQAGSESDIETLQLIAQIAADGDRAIVQLNACIDAYNTVREQVNSQGK